MLKKYMKKKQYAKIKSYVESSIAFIQKSIDNTSDDEVYAITIKECRIAQQIVLQEVLRFIEHQEEES